jgi:hypothetical protein
VTDQREISELLVEDIVSKYKPIYPEPGDSWQDTVEWLYANERERMDELFENIKRVGVREPIVLTDDPDEAPYVSNGTHRVAMALYHGLITLPTTDRYPELNSPDEKYLRLKIELLNESGLSKEYDGMLFDELCSWKLDDEHWVNADTAYGSSSQWEFSFGVTEVKLKRKFEAAVVRNLLRRFQGTASK